MVLPLYQNKMNKIPENIKMVARSIVPFFVVLILFFLVGRFGIPKVIDLRNQIASATVSKNVLTQKVAVLQTLSGTIKDFSSAAATAIPDSNTSLAVISQLKNLATGNGTLISGIKSGVEVKDATGLSRVDINFKVAGNRQQIMTFLKGISGFAPITTTGRVKIEEAVGVVTADVAVSSYWASIPKTLPATDQAVSDFTADEKAVLTGISSLSQPIFSVLPPTSGGGRTDPFSQ